MRREFTGKIKAAARLRAKGCCELCETGIKLRVGDIFYDHRIPDGLGGEPTLENCQVLCRSHHDIKTRKADVPAIAKSKRIQRREAGIRKPTSFRGWRKMNGRDVVFASRER